MRLKATMGIMLTLPLIILLSTALVTPTLAVNGDTDITGDGKVDMEDIAEICYAFGSFNASDDPYRPEHPRWNSAADIDGNGIVDMLDITLVCMDFGKGT